MQREIIEGNNLDRFLSDTYKFNQSGEGTNSGMKKKRKLKGVKRIHRKLENPGEEPVLFCVKRSRPELDTNVICKQLDFNF